MLSTFAQKLKLGKDKIEGGITQILVPLLREGAGALQVVGTQTPEFSLPWMHCALVPTENFRSPLEPPDSLYLPIT